MPLDSDEIDDLIDDVASSDKSITSNGRSVTSHDIGDLIELDKYRRNKAAQASVSGNPFGCLKMVKLVPPGGG